VEFSNHNRTYFDRYHIYRANRTGDDIRIEFNQTLQEDVPIGTYMRLYTQPHPSGYFITNVSLFGGANRISSWGVDQAGNAGNATHDWINAPYPSTAPSAPVIWPLPEAFMFDSNNLTVIGFINESSTVNLNLTLDFVQGYNFSLRWDNESYKHSYVLAESPVSVSVPAGNDFFYVTDYDYTRMGSGNFTGMWAEFSNHNRTYWLRYNITNTTNNPGEDARIYVSPRLEASVGAGVQMYIYNATHRQGWFNISVNKITTPIWNGSNEFYAVAFRNGFIIPIEGYRSLSQFIYQDITPPTFNLTGIPSYSPIRTPHFAFNVSDDYKVNISSLLVNVSNATGWNTTYAYNSSSFPGLPILQNISCTDLFGNKSVYECGFDLNWTDNGTYVVNVSVSDIAGWFNYSNKSMVIQVTKVEVLSVLDEDDITNDAWLYFNWTLSGGELNSSEFALGTAPYPSSGWNSVKGWQSTCTVFNDCSRTYVNFTHDMNVSDINATELKMMTGTVYYLTVRAKNRAGEYSSTNRSSDGILFIDQTPPLLKYINDRGPWSNSDNHLTADWLFEDNESDIIEYMYTLGTATYPNPGYNSIKGPTLITSNSVVNDMLSLVDDVTYYYSVKARNGNVAMNYSGSWSSWWGSGGVTVDTLPPSGGFILWQNATYATSGFVTVHYYVGQDHGSSDNVKGMIEVGRGILTNDVCPVISDFDWYNTSDILTGESYRDVNVTSGYCYVFRLYAWDNASNGVTYHTTNETLKVVKADTTAPSDVAPVVDDGFYTNSRTSLHANWADSYDPESGFDHYEWHIYQQPTAGGANCVVNTTDPIGTNCTHVRGGNSTASEISRADLDLTHNHKYYFEVRAWNRAGMNSTTRYSDGIIYLDNAPPRNVSILQVNDANESHSPYLTRLQTNNINVTAIGDIEGYNDIANCVLLNSSIDYTESYPYARNCTVWPHNRSYGEYPDVTVINCSRNTSDTAPLQGTWTWYLSCRDHYWNTNSYEQNTLVWFTVNWPEAPTFDFIRIVNEFGALPPFDAATDLYCQAEIRDGEGDFNASNITFVWTNGAGEIRRSVRSGDLQPGGSFFAEDILPASLTERGQNVTCTVYASDNTSMVNSTNTSLIIQNNPSDWVLLLNPVSETVTKNATFRWSGPSEDMVDHDFVTYRIDIDVDGNSTAPVFYYANNSPISYFGQIMLNVSGVTLPGKQQNADVYRNLVVYEDDRAGNWDIYMYDLDSGTETPVAIGSGNQVNPQIYGHLITYEESGNLYNYSIDDAVTVLVKSGIKPGSSRLFGDYVAYHDTGGVRFMRLTQDGREIGTYGSLTTDNVTDVYGKNIIWRTAPGDAILYDMISNSTTNLGLGTVDAVMFGQVAALESAGAIRIVNLSNTSVYYDLLGGNASIYGGLLAREYGGNIVVTDLLTSDHYNVTVAAGSNPEIYNNVVVFENGNDLYYAYRNVSLPASFIFENPVDANTYMIDTTRSLDNRSYAWRMQACDNSFMSNSCIWAFDGGLPLKYFALFSIDNTVPVISGISPANSSVVAGIFKIHAKITDNFGDANVVSANFTILNRPSGAVFRSSTPMTRSGNKWNSSDIDFSSISLANFTVFISARDDSGNWAHSSSDFTVDSNSPWFVFGTGADEITVDDLKTFNDTINSDFIAYTVLRSTVKMVGPLPSSTVRFIQSKVNLTVVNHNYSDPISIATWPEGNYSVSINGSNYDLPNGRVEERLFWIDRTAPRYSGLSPIRIYANETLTLSVNWTDLTLGSMNFTYNNTNKSNPALSTSGFNATASQQYTKALGGVASFINSTFYWRSAAIDRAGQVNDTGWQAVDVVDNAPYLVQALPALSVMEDSLNISGINLAVSFASNFADPNTVGVWAFTDNLTYSIADNCSLVDIEINDTAGLLKKINATSNYTGTCNVMVNVSDYYKNWTSANFTLGVMNVNDAPYLDAISDRTTDEDNSSGINYSLSGFAHDIDPGDSISWGMPDYDRSVFNLTAGHYNLATGEFNFTLVADAFGDYNITFNISDSVGARAYQNATVHITGINDAPLIGSFASPSVGQVRNSTVTISWTNATDRANEGQALRYRLEYSLDGGLTWSLLADYSTLEQNRSYAWDTVAALGSVERNVTLALNVSDSIDTNRTVLGGNFTVDNLAPQITINRPAAVVVVASPSFTTDITTQENAWCDVYRNGTVVGSTGGALGVMSHQVTVSGEYNTTYNLTVSCRDSLSHINSSSVLFEMRQTALEFIRAYATPSWVYQNGVVNITLEIASNNTLGTMNLRVIRPSAAFQSLAVGHFSPTVNANNKVTSLNGAVSISTSEIGKYNLSVDLLDNTDASIGPLPIIADLFEVFESVNQTLNVK
jgi:beta propeller repeat protein